MNRHCALLVLLCLALIPLRLTGCKTGQTTTDEKISEQQAKVDVAQQGREATEASLEQERLRSTRLEGQLSSQAGLAPAKDSTRALQLDLQVAMSFRARLDSLVAARDFPVAGTTAKRLQDLLQFIKSELPAVRVRICLERARLSLAQINREAAVRAVIQAQNITLDEADATPYLLPPESSQLDAARKALIDGNMDAATQAIDAIMKAVTDTPEEVLADQALGTVAAVSNALNRQAVISAQAELSQLAETLGQLNDRIRGIGLRSPAALPAAQPGTAPQQPSTPAPSTPPTTPSTPSAPTTPEGTGSAPSQPRAPGSSI